MDGQDSLCEPRDYVSIRLGTNEVYTGEVDKNGKKCGKGIRVLLAPEYFFIEEGIFINNVNNEVRNGLSRAFAYYKKS